MVTNAPHNLYFPVFPSGAQSELFTDPEVKQNDSLFFIGIYSLASNLLILRDLLHNTTNARVVNL